MDSQHLRITCGSSTRTPSVTPEREETQSAPAPDSPNVERHKLD